jgi:hypothetical protein
MFSPAAALAQSLKSGKAEGILGMTPIGAMVNQADKRRRRSGEGPSEPSGPTGVTGMKKGGKVGRGDGACMKGRTKGKMV